MTITPLPSWLSLISLFKTERLNSEQLLEKWINEDEVGGWLSKSAWSLAMIGLWKERQRTDKNKKLVIWIPDFFCNGSLTPLRSLDVELIFYQISHDFEPDYKSCRTEAKKNPPDIFLIVHYFGKVANGAAAKEFCVLNKCWLIEDAAHVLRPNNGIGKFGDFVLYSQHKLLPIYDGATLIVREKGPSLFGKEFIEGLGPSESWPVKLRVRFKGETFFLKGRFDSILWLIKRILQKCLIRKKVKKSLSPLNEPIQLISHFDPEMSTLSKKLLKSELSRLAIVSSHRHRNSNIWDYILSGDNMYLDNFFLSKTSYVNDSVPYLAVIKTNNNYKKTFNELQGLQSQPTTWPDLPPEVVKNSEKHVRAIELRKSRIYLPVHQSITNKELINILGKTKRLVKEGSIDGKLCLISSQNEWEHFFKQIERSNLLQSWSYGSAKFKCEGWAVSRWVYKNSEGKKLAIFQVLEKKILGIIKLRRINRGPLFFPEVNQQERIKVCFEILKFGNIWERRILTIAPEFLFTGLNFSTIISNKVYIPSPKGYESIWVNLKKDTDKLRSSLSTSWRNKLKISEKNNIQIEIGANEELKKWMLVTYSENMKIKGFTGISLPILKHLFNSKSKNCEIIICRASIDKTNISGLCVVTHGSSATYLIGWTGQLGRKKRANHFMLWSVIKELKVRGLEWLDLGGIDAESTPGITDFKLGMGGERYELMGESWKF